MGGSRYRPMECGLLSGSAAQTAIEVRHPVERCLACEADRSGPW
jgi:hypothetical protein